MERICRICGFVPARAYLMDACICHMSNEELINRYKVERGQGPLADHLRKLMDERCLTY